MTSYPRIRKYKTPSVGLGFKRTTKSLQNWQMVPRLRRVRLGTGMFRDISDTTSFGSVMTPHVLNPTADVLARPDISGAMPPGRAISNKAALLSSEGLFQNSEKAALSAFVPGYHMPSAKSAERPPLLTENTSQHQRVTIGSSKVGQTSIAVPVATVPGLPQKSHILENNDRIEPTSSVSADPRVSPPGLPVSSSSNIQETSLLPVKVSDDPFQTKPAEKERLPVEIAQNIGLSNDFPAAPRIGKAYQMSSAGQNGEQCSVTPMTDPGNVTGELWLDTQSLRDWLTTYLNEEVARAAGGGNLTAGALWDR